MLTLLVSSDAIECTFQNLLGIVVSSIQGQYKNSLLPCSFTHLKVVNMSNPEYSMVPNLQSEYYYFLQLGIGPASTEGKNVSFLTLNINQPDAEIKK